MVSPAPGDGLGTAPAGRAVRWTVGVAAGCGAGAPVEVPVGRRRGCGRTCGQVPPSSVPTGVFRGWWGVATMGAPHGWGRGLASAGCVDCWESRVTRLETLDDHCSGSAAGAGAIAPFRGDPDEQAWRLPADDAPHAVISTTWESSSHTTAVRASRAARWSLSMSGRFVAAGVGAAFPGGGGSGHHGVEHDPRR